MSYHSSRWHPNKPGKVSRWREYFQALLNRPIISPSPTVREVASEALPVDIIPVAVQNEVASAIAKLRSFRAPGICGIQPELLKAGAGCSANWLTQVMQSLGNWFSSAGLEKRDCSFILQGHGSRHDCSNYRGITLLPVSGKVYVYVLSRIKSHLYELHRGLALAKRSSSQCQSWLWTVEAEKLLVLRVKSSFQRALVIWLYIHVHVTEEWLFYQFLVFFPVPFSLYISVSHSSLCCVLIISFRVKTLNEMIDWLIADIISWYVNGCCLSYLCYACLQFICP